MNKKIKLSLLGVLFAGSALAVTMPIVSCSSSTPATTLTVEGTNGVTPAQVRTLVTGAPADTLTKADFDKLIAMKIAPNATTPAGVDAVIEAAKGLTFKNGTEAVTFENAVESITFTGTYTATADAPINVKVVIVLKSAYTADAAKLTTADINIGKGVAA